MERVGEWFPFSKQQFLRRTVNYTLGSTDLEQLLSSAIATAEGLIVALAPCGGPIAVVCQNGRTIDIFSCSGHLLKEFALPTDSGTVVACGWTKEETLAVLTSRRHFAFFELSSSAATSATSAACSPCAIIKLPDEKEAPQRPCEVSCHWFRGGGCGVVMTRSGAPSHMELIVTDERRDPSRVSIPLTELREARPTCCELLPHDINEDDASLVYIGTATGGDASWSKRGTVFIASSSMTVVDSGLMVPGGVMAMALSPGAEQLVVYSGVGTVFVCPPNVECFRVVVHLGVAGVAPRYFGWCGTRFIQATFSNVGVGTDDDITGTFTLCFPDRGEDVNIERISWDDAGGWCTVASEVDGMRIVTPTDVQFIEDVPPALVQLCQLKPTSLVAVFAAAFQQMSSGDVRGLIALRDMVNTTRADVFETDVIEALLDAAASEFSVDHQEAILAAAADAKSRCQTFDSERYVDMVKRLRILNALRTPNCGMPVSVRQYQLLSGAEQLRTLSPSEVQVLVDRLINRRNFQLALDIATSMRVKVQKVLIQWACTLVHNKGMSDEAVADAIHRALKAHTGTSLVEAARVALLVGRHPLAFRLLESEPRATQQVMLLLQMGQVEVALEKALCSDEVDLVVMIVAKLIVTLSKQEIMNLTGSQPFLRRFIQLGSTELESWRQTLHNYWKDSQQLYLVGYERLDQLLANDRDRGAMWRGLNNPPGVPGPEHVTTNPQAAFRADDSASHDRAADVETDEFDDLEALRAKSDDEDEKPTSSVLGGLFSKKSKKKAETPPASQPVVVADESGSQTPLRVKGVPIRSGRLDVTTDDMIELCQYFTVSSRSTSGAVASSVSTLAAESDGRWCRNHLALLAEQQQLADDTGCDDFINSSVVRTLELCFMHDVDATAEKLRSKFGVDERKFTFTKLRALCAAKRWADIDKMFSVTPKSVRSCIGVAPIVEELYKYQRESQMLQYIPRLDDVCDRVDWFVRLGCFQLAIDDAYQEESSDLIRQIVKRAQNPSVIEYGQKRIRELDS